MKKTWKEKNKKEKIRTVLTICQRICAGIAAGIIILCFAFVGFKRCSGNKSMVKLAYAAEANTRAITTSTETYFQNLWQEKTTSFTPNCKPAWAILNGFPEAISYNAQILPNGSFGEVSYDPNNSSYYTIEKTFQDPMSLENTGYNIFCISGYTLMTDTATMAIIAVVDTYEDETQQTTWIAASLSSTTINGSIYPYSGTAYRWTESGSTTLTQLQAKYSGGFSSIEASQSGSNTPFTIGTGINKNTLTYFKLPTEANITERTILAKIRLDYEIRLFDYSLYNGDNATTKLADKIEENFNKNWSGIAGIYNGTGGGGTSGITQEEYNQLNQKYNTVLNENILLQNQLAAAQTNYNNLLYNTIPGLRTEIENLEQQITALRTTNNTLNTDIETLENEKANLQIQLSDKEAELEEKENLITILDGTITQLNTTIDQLEADLNQEGNRWKQGYDVGFKAGEDSVKAMNAALTLIPKWAVTIWNDGIAKILMFDIYGFKIGEIFLGLTTLIVVFTITVNVLKK